MEVIIFINIQTQYPNISAAASSALNMVSLVERKPGCQDIINLRRSTLKIISQLIALQLQLPFAFPKKGLDKFFNDIA
jgi:hypothetical protein